MYAHDGILFSRCALNNCKENSKASRSPLLFPSSSQDRDSQKQMSVCVPRLSPFSDQAFPSDISLICFVPNLLLYRLVSKVIKQKVWDLKKKKQWVFTGMKSELPWGGEEKAAKRINTDKVTDLPSAISTMWPLGPAHREAKKCWCEGKKSQRVTSKRNKGQCLWRERLENPHRL